MPKKQPSQPKIRLEAPAAGTHLKPLVAFFRGLPPGFRNHLRYDVTDEAACQRRLDQLDGRDHWRLVARVGEEIIGDATMDREPFAWTRHVAAIRVIVYPAFEHLDLGQRLLRELLAIGADEGIDLVYTELMPEQEDLIAALEAAGFRREWVRRGYARDLDGRPHDVLVMANDLEEVWRRLEDLIDHPSRKMIQSD